MNKYDKKVLEIAPEASSIQELSRRPIRSRFAHFVDMLLDSPLIVLDSFQKGAYYLLVDKTNAELVHIDRDLTVSQKDVTNVISSMGNKRSF